MKKRLAAFAATGALAVGAFAGTMGSASAAVARPDNLPSACSSVSGCFYWEGAFSNASSCVSFVGSLGNPAGWDCEYYNPVWFPGNNGPGWYATSVYFPKYP